MKIIKVTLLFLIFCIPIFFVVVLDGYRLRGSESERIKYNNALDGAVRDALYNLVEYDSGQIKYVNKDVAVSNFFGSLCSRLGVSDSLYKDEIKLYVPIFLVSEEDGFYVYYSYDYEDENGSRRVAQDWSDKMPYSYKYDKYIINFSMSEHVTLLNTENSYSIDGDYRELSEGFKDIPFFKDVKSYDIVRRSAIIEAISNSMEFYINQHNRIAHQFGINYHFYIPSISNDDWNRTIDRIGMIVVFQGYPYRSANHSYFNRIEVSAARINKTDYYYIVDVDGIPYYHEEKCIYVNDYRNPYDTTFECASKGAFPCDYCKP